MTLIEYITSLQDTGLSRDEIIAKTKEFKKTIGLEDTKVTETPVEEVKTEVVVEKDAAAATTPGASESLISGSGEPTFTSMYDEDATAKLKLKDINRQIERSIATDAQRALKTSKIVFQDEYESFDPYGTGEAGEIGLESRKSTLGLVESKPASEEDKLIRSFKESTDLSKEQFDSLYSDIYDNENLFTPVETQKLIEGSTGSGMDIKMGLMTPSLQETITIIPNEEELKTALKQLESKPRKIGAPKISKKDIEDRARQNMFNSRARDIKMQNATDFIFNIPEYQKDEDGNFLRDEEGNKIPNRKAAQDLIAENIITNRNKATWDVEDFGKDLELSLSKFQESPLVENFKSYSKALKGKQEKIKKLADSIVKKQKNGKPVVEDLIEYKNEANNYKSFIDQYNKLGLNLKNESIDLENRVVEYNDMISSIEDSGVQLDALGRVYDKFEKRYTDLVLGAYSISINSAAFIETALNQMSTRSLELDEEGKPTGELAPGSTFFQDEAKKLATVKEFVYNKYYKPVSFKNAFDSEENFIEYGIDQAIAQAPIFGAIASGGFGMFAVSAASAGEYQAGRQLESEQLFGREADETTVFLQSLGFGAAEYVFGAGPTALILKGTYRGATASGKRKILDGYKNYFRTIRKNGPLDLGLIAVDAGGEGLTVAFQNGIDGRPLLENVPESTFTGGLFASLTASAPYFKGAFSAALSDYKTNADYRENLKMINTLDRSMNNPWITEADKAGIEKSKQDLIDQNNEIVEQRVNLATNNLNKQGGELLQQSMKRQEELRNQAEALENNNSIPDDQKASILNALEAEFDQIEAGADKFKQAFTNTFGLLSNKEQSRLKTEAERLLKVDGNQNISGDKIARKAEQLHTKEKLEQTLQSDQSTLKALAGAGIEVGYSVEDTNAGAIKSFTAMMNFRAADENNSITQEQADSLIEEFTDGINDGTLNGFNVPSTNTKTGKKVYDSITSVQNSIANERSQTSLHELGHVITTEALGSDPAAFEETKNLILSYLEKANPEAYTRITTRTRGQSADEVLMVFFEEVADNKIKLDKAKGTGFLGYLGSMLGTAASKASNTDYNYNFKGETDIVNFVKELGRKLKDGTLTVEDVKTIQKEGLGGKKEVPVIPLDEVVVTGVAASKSSREVVSPRGAELIGLVKEGLITNEGLVEIINSPSSKPVDKFGAIDAVVESNWPVISNSIKFNPTGSIPIEAVKTAVTEQFQGIFPGRKKELLKDFDASRNNKLTTVLGPKFLGMRQAEILQRASDIAATSTDSESIDSDKAKQVIDTSTTTFKSSGSAVKPIAQTDATSFGPAKNKKQDLESIIQVEDVDRPNFKTLSNKYFNEVAENLFGIEGKKVRGNASLKYGATNGNPTSSEANTLQNVFKNSENARSFIRTMPKYNVATKEAIINKQGESVDVSRDTYGRALGTNPKILEVFYDKVNTAIPGISSPKGSSLGKTTQPQVFKIKPEFDAELKPIGNKAVTKLQSLIGITPSGELSIPVKGPARTEFGSALTGLSKMYVDNVINTVGRSKLDSKQAKADLGAGKPKSMASKETQKLDWKQTDEALVASFKVGNRTYKTTLEETAFMEFDEGQTYRDIESIAKDLDILKDAEGDPIESSENFYHLEFGDTKLGKGITGEGNAFEVFTTTMNGVVDYLKANPKIEGVVFTAKEPSRIRLYKTLSQVLAGKLNGSYGFKNDTFIVSTKPEATSKPKSMASREVKAEDIRTAAEKSTGKITGSTLSNYSVKQLDDLGFKTVADVKEFLKLPVLPAREINGKLRAADKDVPLKSGYKMLGGNLDLMTDAIKEFLSEFPQYREIIRRSTTNGLSRSSIGSPKVFDRVIPKSDKKYDIIYRNTYKAKDRKLSKPFVKTTKSSGFVSAQYAKLDYLKNYWIDIQSFLKKKPELSFLFEQMLDDAQNDMGSLMRISPPILYLPLNSKGEIDFNSEIREEHNMPQNNVGSMLLDAAINGNVEQVFKVVSATYMQGPLTMADDDKVNIKYSRSMPDFFWDTMVPRILSGDLKIPEGTASLIRLVESDINLDNYNFLPENKTFSEYFFSTNGLPTNIQSKLLKDFFAGDATLKQIRNQGLAYNELAPGMARASKENNSILPEAIKYDKDITVPMSIAALEKTDKALELARKIDQPVKKIRVFDFDDTLARTKSNVLYTMPDGTTGAIDAATFAKEAGNMEAEGAQWDFSEFSKVMQGSKGPLLDVAKIIADKRGTKDVFVLTARPADAAGPIKEFLASMGLDIPLANITGLGDGTPQAKAGWIMGKAAEGYNDFYFADDHTGNVKAVKNVLSQIDVKSKVQLAKASKEQTFNTIVNDMIEDSSGIESYKKYSAARAKTVGASKGKYNFLIPPSAEDFTGLLYKMLGKGKKGDAQMAFLKTNLLDTYNRAESAVTQAKISAANDFVALKTKLKTLPKTLSKETGIGKFTYSHAVRVAAWTKQGMDIPGLSKRDIKELNDFVNKDAKLRVFTDELIKIQKGKEYPKPGKDWLGGNITTDIIGGINKVNRAEYQQEWRENIDIIFSEDNMNKMEAAYGSRWREAMEDSIRRMKSGSNRPIGGNRVTEGLLNWLNNSVGAVMFLNTRSALLQTISAVNFINLSDNNIVKAGAAFANQKQFWGDFMTLMNSDYLVERRNGLKINVSESEIADAVRESKNKPKAAIAFLLSKGFVMTRFADSFAIASGGSTFYRNRVNKYVKEGIEQSVAEKQAFADFKAIAEENQQSSSPSKISQQQASAAGRVILAWANTPMQYARIQKRAAQDIINGRGDWKTNVSKIVYYGAIQNLIFNALQSAAFALGFGDDEEETDEAKSKKKEEKAYKILNGMIDSQLRGLGVFGTASVALKNTLMTLYEEHGKKGSKYENAVEDLLSFSPPLGSKIGKITGGLRSASWNKKDMKEKGFSLDNPAYIAGAQVVTGLTNVPFDRVMKKINNIRGIVNERSALWQKVALGLGWSTWDVGLGYYGGFDKEKPLTPKQQLKLEVDTMKKDTSKEDQVKTLLDFGLTKKQVRELKNENNRVKKILELQKKDKK